MPVTLIATPGDPTANAYADVAWGDQYHTTHPYPATWTAANSDQKAIALITATRLLDERFDWFGYVTTIAQALLWPRINVADANGWLIDSSIIPARLKDATAEFARQILDANRMLDNDIQTQGIKRVQVASLSLEFDGTTTAKVVPDAVLQMVSRYGTARGLGGTLKLVRT